MHAGTYAGTATYAYFDLQRTISMKIEITTRDGLAPSYVFRPEGRGRGPWPAVLVFMDGIGIRPAMLEIGAALADVDAATRAIVRQRALEPVLRGLFP